MTQLLEPAAELHLSVIRRERYEAMVAEAGPGGDPRVSTIVPDLAVEVVPPTNTIEGMGSKLALYRQVDFPLIWVVHLASGRSTCTRPTAGYGRTPRTRSTPARHCRVSR